MHTSSAVSKPSPKVPAAAADPGGPTTGAEGAEGGAAERFSDVIAQAGEQQEAARHPSANDVLPVPPGIPLNPSPEAAAPTGRSDAPVGSTRLSPAASRLRGDAAPEEGGPDATTSDQGSADVTALLAGPAGASAPGARVGDGKSGSRGLAEAVAGSAGEAAAAQAVPPGPDAPDAAAEGAAPALPARTGMQALDATATAAAATAAAAAAAAATRPAATAAGADGPGHDRGARLRRAATESPPSERVDAGGGLKVETAFPAGSPHQGTDPLTHLAGTASSGAELQGAGAAATAAASGNNGGNGASDASVFALTMNQPQATGTLAATRSEMIAEMTQSAIGVPVDHADFGEAFARQSASLIVQGSSSAEIRLTPQDMGPIRIAISLEADAVSLDMAAENADTRAAIEASMPALRQMLADQGIRLADWRLVSEPGADRQPPTGGDAGRRHGEQGPGSGDGGMQQAAADASSNAGNGFANGRGTGQFSRQGSGWAPGAAPVAGSGISRDGAAAGTGAGRLDLYA